VRVRTYCFPGCFTRPPGTSTRHHSHEPTASKPVVPVCVSYTSSVAVRARLGGNDGPAGAAPENKSDAVPSRSRNQLGPVRGPFLVGGAASHLSGLALCDLVPRLDSK
jgi:hypothetical protein